MNARPPPEQDTGAPRRAGRRRPLPRTGACCIRLLVTLGAVTGTFLGRAAEPPPPADPPVLLPPWVLEERVDRQLQPAREDSFASTLGPTSVVTAASWSGRSIATLTEALRRAPGVMLQESFGGWEPPRLSIRGSGLDSAPTARGVALLIDGLSLARADGSFHSGLLDPQLFSRIEVYRGTMHMALTPAVLGGVLNAVPPPAEARAGAAFRLEAGDFGARRARVAFNSPSLRFTGTHAHARGWRDASGQERHAAEAAFRSPLGPATRLELAGYAARARYDVPGPLTLADALSRPRSISAAAQRDRPHRDSNLLRASAQVKSHVDGTRFAAGLSFQRLRDNFRQLVANGETDATSDDLATQATYARRVLLAGREHHLLARATFSTGINRAERFHNLRSVRGTRFGAYDARADTGALSLEDILWLRPSLAIGAAVTLLHAERELRDRSGGTGFARTLRFDDVSPRVGITWVANPTTTVFAALSRGIEPPSFDDLLSVAGASPNLTLRSRALRAQRSTTVEIGARGSLGRLGWSTTAYRGTWRDEILRLADASGQPRGAVNAGRTIHEGIETTLRWTVRDAPHRLTVSATSTLGRFRFEDDPVYGRNRIAGAPPHVGGAELSYEHPRGFTAAIESTWVAGRTSVDHAGRLGYGGHGLWHARVSWQPAPRWTVFAAVRNLFDHPHLASTAGVLDLARAPAATTIFLPGPGRGFTVGLEWRQ